MSVPRKLGKFSDALLDKQIEDIIQWFRRPILTIPSIGLIVTTPDGTKQYRIRVDNAGAIVTELI